MYVLVACEESQTVTKELRRLGHNAFSCDIIECSGGHPEWHIQSDVLKILRNQRVPFCGEGVPFQTCDGLRHFVAGGWDMIIAHPPCTYFSTAGANWLFRGGKVDEERYQKGLEMKKLFLAIYNADCPRIAIENPVVMKIWDLPKHTQEIQPYQFGDPYSKKTRLWLKGLPKLEPTEIIEPVAKWVSCGNKSNREKQNLAVCKAHTRLRAKTFPGIARAMAEQWAGSVFEETET